MFDAALCLAAHEAGKSKSLRRLFLFSLSLFYKKNKMFVEPHLPLDVKAFRGSAREKLQNNKAGEQEKSGGI